MHPNIIGIYDYGCTEAGQLYYAMEFVSGLNLKALTVRFGPQPPSRVVAVLIQVAAALREAHAAGVLHRDVKPENIMLAERRGSADLVKLVDFGLAARLADLTSEPTDIVRGTPGYMAPEVMVAAHQAGPLSDIFAVGAVAFFILTGRKPWGSLASQLTEDAPPILSVLPSVPADLALMVDRCLSREPAKRPPSAEALANELMKCGCLKDWGQAEAQTWWATNGRAEVAKQAELVDAKHLPELVLKPKLAPLDDATRPVARPAES